MKTRMGAALLALGLLAPPVMAQETDDGLETCIVASVTEADRNVLVRWMFSAISLHAGLRDLATVPAEQRDAASAEMGAMMQRLMTRDCASQARQAFAGERASAAFQQAFRRVGELAGEGRYQDPAVAAEAGGVVRHVDMAKIVELLLP